jgi:DNA-3-methyladenine glycosylase
MVYVYFIYGMYYCLNFTTDRRGTGAILIRALEPLTGLAQMRRRRGVDDVRQLCSGPGKLTSACGIDQKFNWTPVGGQLKILPGRAGDIVQASRIGIRKATDLPWRFYERDNEFVSRK